MKVEDIQRILVIGAGTMGQQIALQCALYGYHVNLYDIELAGLESGLKAVRSYTDGMLVAGSLTPEAADQALERIHPFTSPEEAASGVDLVSESVPEDPQLKGQTFAQFNLLCPERAVFTTNTSSLLPSMFAEATGRPERFAALHFHTFVWESNVVDIMPHAGTADWVVGLLSAFALRIGQIPIVLEKESYGYVFNAMLNALNRAALTLAANGIADPRDVDRAWMGVMHTQIGPFGILDRVGLETAWHINQYWADVLADEQLQKNADYLKAYLDRGWLGVKTGRGFYEYPDSAYTRPDFLSGPAV